LLEGGHTVLVIDDLSTGRRENVPAGAEFREGDLRDGAFMQRVFDEFRPEVVNHQAAQTSVAVSTREPLRDATVNVIGSLELIRQCVRTKVRRVVYASTGGAVYGEVPEGERATVRSPARPLSPYACSKFAVECYLGAYAHEYGLRATVLRYANVYGPRQDPHGEAGVVAVFTERLMTQQPIQVNARREVGDAGCVRDYVYVGDVVRYNVQAVAGALAEPVVNVCTGEPTATRELAEALAAAIGTTFEARAAGRRPGDVERSVLEPGPSPLGAATPLAEGLSHTVAWFKAQSSGSHAARTSEAR
jgi:UDP-glucose 4-epimerase